MAEVSNTTLAVLIIAALVVVAAGTFLSFTGYASSDTGYVNLTIGQALNIQVDSTNKTINFGTCTPQVSPIVYWCASNDTMPCNVASGSAANNCSADTNNTVQFIRIDNIGNVDANVNVTSSCTAQQLIGGASGLANMTFISTQCNGTGVSSWATLGTTTAAVCNNISYLGGMTRFYVNVSVPYDATGGCGNQATLTFSAIVAP